jgi:hypothetical protein
MFGLPVRRRRDNACPPQRCRRRHYTRGGLCLCPRWRVLRRRKNEFARISFSPRIDPVLRVRSKFDRSTFECRGALNTNWNSAAGTPSPLLSCHESESLPHEVRLLIKNQGAGGRPSDTAIGACTERTEPCRAVACREVVDKRRATVPPETTDHSSSGALAWVGSHLSCGHRATRVSGEILPGPRETRPTRRGASRRALQMSRAFLSRSRRVRRGSERCSRRESVRL